MIYLNGKDSFVIYHDKNSKTNQLIIGKWTLLKTKIHKPSFVFNLFNNQSYIINGESATINENVIIKNPTNFNILQTKKEEYLESVNRVIKYCKEGILEKCILCRVINQEFNSENYYTIFQKLCKKYKQGFKYLLNHPKFGMWVGVSPETLISGNTEKDFHTQALAGSLSNKKNEKWTLKEKEEHQYVVDFIKEKISQNGNIHFESRTYEKTAGAVKHLNKDFKFSLKIDYFSFLNYFHPTPAIAGIPLNKSLEIINAIEPHNRSLYCGYIGLVDQNSCDLYVNLRCARISSQELQIFVGGGITSKSIAEKEYLETEIKSQTLLSVIKKL